MDVAVQSLGMNKFIVSGFVRSWLSQECWNGHIQFGTNNANTKLSLVPSSSGVLAGSPFIESLFKEYDCTIEWHVPEGQNFNAKSKVMSVAGRRYDLLCCERLATSIMSRASGIASQTKKLRKLLTELSWKGKLLVTPLLTPGFGPVEEYAMIVGGAEPCTALTYMRQSEVSLLGGIDMAVKCTRSKNPSAKIAIECLTLSDAIAASVSGADIVVFLTVKLKDFSSVVSQVKKSHPAVQTCVIDALDENNLRAAALSTVDLIASTKLINGYDLIEFQTDCEGFNTPVESAAPEENSRSSSPEIIDEKSSSATPSALKRPRLNDENDAVQTTTTTTIAATYKPNGVVNRGSAVQNVDNTSPSSESRTGVGSTVRKTQRNHKMLLPQPGTTPRRPSPLSHRGPMGNAPPRSMAPGMLPLRPPPNMSSSLMGNNPHQGSLMVPSSNPYSMPGPRMSGQSSTPRHASGPTPGMLGNGPNVVANFLGLQTSGSQPGGGGGGGGGSGMHPNRQLMGSTGGPIMGGVAGGLGMRFWGPGGFPNCRQCGVTNPPGHNCCRNCRAPLR